MQLWYYGGGVIYLLWNLHILSKLYGVAPLIASPSFANSTTDMDTHPISDICDTMVNLILLLYRQIWEEEDSVD